MLLLLCIAIPGYWYLWEAIRGKPHLLRVLPQFLAVSDGIDKAVEEGRPVFVGVGGYAYLSGLYSTMTIAGIQTTRYVARQAVRKGAQVRFPMPIQPEIQPLIDAIYRQICIEEGKPDVYRREHIRYSGNSDESYNLGTFGFIMSEGCSCLIMVGALIGGDAASLSAVREVFGGVTIGGTPRWAHQGTFTMTMNYPLFMDDTYAFAALCSEDQVVMSNLASADWPKLIVFGLTLILAILALAGLPTYGRTGWLGF